LVFFVLMNGGWACRLEEIGLGRGGGVVQTSPPPRRPLPTAAVPSDAGVAGVDAAVLDPPPAGDRDARAPMRDAVSDAVLGAPGMLDAPSAAPDAGDAATPATDLRQGLLLSLPLDEPTGAAGTRDDSGQDNRVRLQGLNAGAAWVPGRLGGALDLASGGAGSGYVQVDSSPSLNRIGDQLTIALWVSHPAGKPGVVISRRATAAGGGSLYRLEITAMDQPRLVLNDRAGVRLTLAGNTRLLPDTWFHLAVTSDQKEARMYIDGHLIARVVYGVPIAPDVSPVLIGAREAASTGQASDFLDARLDELVIYDRALVEQDIAALAAGTLPYLR
jgi:hypothetical protein